MFPKLILSYHIGNGWEILMSKMPALFIGHGSPMNAIEDNQYTKTWKSIAEKIPKPEVILSVSAHWFTRAPEL